jgi:hypothetical protein
MAGNHRQIGSWCRWGRARAAVVVVVLTVPTVAAAVGAGPAAAAAPPGQVSSFSAGISLPQGIVSGPDVFLGAHPEVTLF